MALTLSRKQSESIFIGTTRVTVRTIGRNRVKLDIDAPPEVNICRSEIAAASAVGRLAALEADLDAREGSAQ